MRSRPRHATRLALILPSVTPADWIALAQAIFLAVAAIFAWRTYRLAKQQRLEAAKELRRTEDRRILQAISDEVLQLAQDNELRTPDAVDVIEGDLQRLRFALALAPMRLDQTDLLSGVDARAARVLRASLEAARIELAEAAARLSPTALDPERPKPALYGQRRNPRIGSEEVPN